MKTKAEPRNPGQSRAHSGSWCDVVCLGQGLCLALGKSSKSNDEPNSPPADLMQGHSGLSYHSGPHSGVWPYDAKDLTPLHSQAASGPLPTWSFLASGHTPPPGSPLCSL